eukprot:GHVO01012938.1.p1 GENE.GHVO01012938.1~~GHVO01012938.1.p1  ORF type:complete len:283 (+),score=45.89 GHVO01012938.1:50-850(+)
MHKHRIPEKAGHFYEQWHQKLHNNTTPDDVGICRALLAFMRSGGNMGEYWKVLSDHNISKERLASYERKISTEPWMVTHANLGALIADFEAYLDILVDVHEALDLKKAFAHARHHLPHEVQQTLEGVVEDVSAISVNLRRRHSFHTLNAASGGDGHRTFLRIAECRRRLVFELQKDNVSVEAVRELLFLDFGLEQRQMLTIQETSAPSMHRITEQLCELLINMSGQDPANAELQVLPFHDYIADMTRHSIRHGLEHQGRFNGILPE